MKKSTVKAIIELRRYIAEEPDKVINVLKTAKLLKVNYRTMKEILVFCTANKLLSIGLCMECFDRELDGEK